MEIWHRIQSNASKIQARDLTQPPNRVIYRYNIRRQITLSSGQLIE